ncbi:hypothetical protein BDV95DRAFT_670766 [Massariosphaeria phaeospora]|uniref:Uncharacterized protein n=1 Tax=Massariosphaeria phaeospora TaxID=100035 RepID=A0A7C8M287_9PLEO|nr:hypothetical protein BDV95DRAFT_670766 [Massariosphaeria phaeospora]
MADFDFPVWNCLCRLKSPDPILDLRAKTGQGKMDRSSPTGARTKSPCGRGKSWGHSASHTPQFVQIGILTGRQGHRAVAALFPARSLRFADPYAQTLKGALDDGCSHRLRCSVLLCSAKYRPYPKIAKQAPGDPQISRQCPRAIKQGLLACKQLYEIIQPHRKVKGNGCPAGSGASEFPIEYGSSLTSRYANFGVWKISGKQECIGLPGLPGGVRDFPENGHWEFRRIPGIGRVYGITAKARSVKWKLGREYGTEAYESMRDFPEDGRLKTGTRRVYGIDANVGG